MKQRKVLNYRIILEPEVMGKKTVYNAYCPSLGVADFGDTVDEALTHIKEAIELTVEFLQEQKEELVSDNVEEQVIASLSIVTP